MGSFQQSRNQHKIERGVGFGSFPVMGNMGSSAVTVVMVEVLLLGGRATIALLYLSFSLLSASINQSTTAIIFGCLFKREKEGVYESVRFFLFQGREGFTVFTFYFIFIYLFVCPLFQEVN